MLEYAIFSLLVWKHHWVPSLSEHRFLEHKMVIQYLYHFYFEFLIHLEAHYYFQLLFSKMEGVKIYSNTGFSSSEGELFFFFDFSLLLFSLSRKWGDVPVWFLFSLFWTWGLGCPWRDWVQVRFKGGSRGRFAEEVIISCLCRVYTWLDNWCIHISYELLWSKPVCISTPLTVGYCIHLTYRQYRPLGVKTHVMLSVHALPVCFSSCLLMGRLYFSSLPVFST